MPACAPVEREVELDDGEGDAELDVKDEELGEVVVAEFEAVAEEVGNGFEAGRPGLHSGTVKYPMRLSGGGALNVSFEGDDRHNRSPLLLTPQQCHCFVVWL